MNAYVDAARRRRLDLTGLSVHDPLRLTVKEEETFYSVECQRKWNKRRFKVQVDGEVEIKITKSNDGGRTIVEVVAE